MTFKSSDIVKIIKACSQSGVKNLKIEGLDVTFIDKCDNISQNLASTEKIYEPLEKTDEVEVEYKTLSEKDRNELLMFSDPEKWEREIIAKETEEAYFIGAEPTL